MGNTDWTPVAEALARLLNAAATALEAFANVRERTERTERSDGSRVARGDQDLSSFPSDTEEKREREAREPFAERSRTEPNESAANAPRTPPLPRFGNVTIRDPLTPGFREIAREFRLEEVENVWAAFVGHYDGQTLSSVSGSWYKWCARQKGIQAKERDKAATRTRLAVSDTELQAPKRDLVSVSARERKREQDDYAKTAVPAPLASLLEAMRPKQKTG